MGLLVLSTDEVIDLFLIYILTSIGETKGGLREKL